MIISGIDRQRARIYEQIYTSGQSQPIDKYTLQAAIRDAFRFHGSCALTSGLIEAQDAIRVVVGHVEVAAGVESDAAEDRLRVFYGVVDADLEIRIHVAEGAAPSLEVVAAAEAGGAGVVESEAVHGRGFAVGDTMIIAPPFVTTDAQLDELVDKAWRALELTHRALGPAVR